MTLQTFNALRMEAENCETLEQYIAKCSGSVPAEWITDDETSEKAVYGLTLIWNLSRAYDFPHLLEMTGLSNLGFSLEYDIPLQTVEDWKMNRSKPRPWAFDVLACSAVGWTVESSCN